MQNDAELRVKHVGGTLEHVKNVTVNLHALTTHTLATMEQECQVTSHAAGHSHPSSLSCILASFTIRSAQYSMYQLHVECEVWSSSPKGQDSFQGFCVVAKLL